MIIGWFLEELKSLHLHVATNSTLAGQSSRSEPQLWVEMRYQDSAFQNDQRIIDQVKGRSKNPSGDEIIRLGSSLHFGDDTILFGRYYIFFGDATKKISWLTVPPRFPRYIFLSGDDVVFFSSDPERHHFGSNH